MPKRARLEDRLERWAPVGQSGVEVSDQGHFRLPSGAPLLPFLWKGGFLYVTIPTKSGPQVMAAHKLVAQAFLGDADNPVRHRNGKRDDIRAENLRYSGNKTYYRTRRERHHTDPLKRNATKATPERVAKFLDLIQKGFEPESLAAELELSVPTIYRWLKLIKTPEGARRLLGRSGKYQGCALGEFCGCTCKQP